MKVLRIFSGRGCKDNNGANESESFPEDGTIKKTFRLFLSCQLTHEDPGKSNDGDSSGKHEDKYEDHLGMEDARTS